MERGFYISLQAIFFFVNLRYLFLIREFGGWGHFQFVARGLSVYYVHSR